MSEVFCANSCSPSLFRVSGSGSLSLYKSDVIFLSSSFAEVKASARSDYKHIGFKNCLYISRRETLIPSPKLFCNDKNAIFFYQKGKINDFQLILGCLETVSCRIETLSLQMVDSFSTDRGYLGEHRNLPLVIAVFH